AAGADDGGTFALSGGGSVLSVPCPSPLRSSVGGASAQAPMAAESADSESAIRPARAMRCMRARYQFEARAVARFLKRLTRDRHLGPHGHRRRPRPVFDFALKSMLSTGGRREPLTQLVEHDGRG